MIVKSVIGMEFGCVNNDNMASTSPTSTSPSNNPIKNVFNGVQFQATRYECSCKLRRETFLVPLHLLNKCGNSILRQMLTLIYCAFFSCDVYVCLVFHNW